MDIEEYKKTNEDLNHISGMISKSYSEASDSLEENLKRVKLLLESDMLDKEEREFYAEQAYSTQRRLVEYDLIQSEEVGKVNRIISENEENIKYMEWNNGKEKEDSEEKDI